MRDPVEAPGPALAGLRAIVTGAAGGLGVGICRRLVADGARVVAMDLQSPEQTSSAIDLPGPALLATRCDVSDPAQVSAACAEAVAQLGGVDILVNNAGLLSGRNSLLTATKEQLAEYYAVNAIGPMLMVQACHPQLRESRHGGRVINIASRTFFTGGPGQIAYVASKGALIGMTRVMARELGPDRITVNAAVPSQVATPGTRSHSDDEVFERTMRQQAIQEFVTPETFAGLVAFLSSPDARLITGQTIVCDGGGLLH